MMGMQKSQEYLIAQVSKMDQEKSSAIKNLEIQIAQLAASQAARQPGHLPSQPTLPSGTFHTANVIHLRSGMSYDSPPMTAVELEVEETSKATPTEAIHRSVVSHTDRSSAHPDKFVKTGTTEAIHRSVDHNTDRWKSGDDEFKASTAAKGTNDGCWKVAGGQMKIQLPFPGRLNRRSPFEEQFAKFKEVLAKHEITISFLDLFMQVSSYIKFLKGLLNRKHSLPKAESVAFTEECRALQQSNSPPKLMDPGSFSIPCILGTLPIDRALCDLGASVNVLPLSLARKMGMT